MTVTYPTGPVTPHGQWHIISGTHPDVVLRSPDRSVEFWMSGGRAIPDRFAAPEVAHLTEIKGLIPPWRHIDQKGATQDGVTHIDALYEPTEIEVTVMCKGRDAAHTRRVVRDLYGSLDAINTSELGWFSHDLGYWWTDVRWFKGAPGDPLMGGQQRRQKVSLRLRADDAFWRTYACTATITTSQWVGRTNLGDVPMYDDYICFGPGEFTFTDGPLSSDTVTFGPLLTNQICLVRTDPRKRGVYDLTVTPPPQQALNQWQQFLQRFISFATANNVPPLLQAIESAFGIDPPQGPLYALLDGRFSDNAAIPPKSPGNTVRTYNVWIGISGGSAATKVIVSGVPLRRYPL